MKLLALVNSSFKNILNKGPHSSFIIPLMTIIEYLTSFNRKERFLLIGQMLGNEPFHLAPDMLQKIAGMLGVPPPDEYFAAMDYHLDWIAASLDLAAKNDEGPRMRDINCIRATQEDVDFLIAFEDEDKLTHIVMIEAKGDTAFSQKQLNSKATRLTAIFGNEGDQWPSVVPHFIICSPRTPTRIKINHLPNFLLNNENNAILWFELNMPTNLQKVTQCDASGKPLNKGSYWKVENITKRATN